MPNKENTPQNENMTVDFVYNGESIALEGHDDHIMSIIDHYETFYERGMLKYIHENIPTDGIFIDAGANIGNHTIFFLKVCKAEFVHAFECAPQNFYYLKKNVISNFVSNNVLLHMRPLAHIPDINYRLAGVNPDNMGMIRVEKGGMMKSVTIDQYCYQPPMERKVRLIKVDCEGKDINVIRGAMKTIDRFRPHLFIEGDRKDFQFVIDMFGYKHEKTFNNTPTHYFKPS